LHFPDLNLLNDRKQLTRRRDVGIRTVAALGTIMLGRGHLLELGMDPGSPVGETRMREAGARYHNVDLSRFLAW
jgi:hypothetical protein